MALTDDDIARVANAVLNTPDAALGGKTVHQVLAGLKSVVVDPIPRSGTGQTGDTSLKSMLANNDDHVGRTLAAIEALALGGVDLPALAELLRPVFAGVLAGSTFVTTTETAATLIPAVDQT